MTRNEEVIEQVRHELNNPSMQKENSQKMLNHIIRLLERGVSPEQLLYMLHHGEDFLEVMKCKQQGMTEDETVFYMQHVYYPKKKQEK